MAKVLIMLHQTTWGLQEEDLDVARILMPFRHTI
jgi:hypothetical protein